MSHWPNDIKEIMGDRNVLTVALDIVGGVRGGRDMILSECANDLNVLEWYMKKWEPTKCLFDQAALDCIRHAHKLGTDWFLAHTKEIGL